MEEAFEALRALALATACAALLLAGCGGSSSDTKTNSPPPTLQPGGCGLSYDWLPADKVGQVISSSELVAEIKKPSTIDALLGFLHYSALSPVKYGMRLFKLRYTTQNRGNSVEATGLVAIPYNEGEKPIDAPMLLELHGTSGFYGPCAPSVDAHNTGLALSFLASQGYIVVAPDFIGLDADADPGKPPDPAHAYLEAEQMAVGSLDMLRAAGKMLAKVPDVARPTHDVVLWGPSQGGHAAFATELYAPYYAPEYHVRAAVAAIPPTDLTGLAVYGLKNWGPTSEGLGAAMVSLDSYYSDGSHVADLLTDAAPDHFASTLPQTIVSSCDGGGAFDNITDVKQVFTPAAIAAARSGQFPAPWSCYLSHNSFATTPVKRYSDTPFFFVLGEKDDLVIPTVERDDFQRLCKMGYRMQFLECSGAGHVDAGKWSVPEQLEWLAARMKGEPMQHVCELAQPTRCSAQP